MAKGRLADQPFVAQFLAYFDKSNHARSPPCIADIIFHQFGKFILAARGAVRLHRKSVCRKQNENADDKNCLMFCKAW
jgi:hypothetical protein